MPVWVDNKAKLRAQSEELEKAAAELKLLLESMMEVDGNLSASWKGDSAEAYLSKLRNTYEEITQLQKEINEAAVSIKEISEECGR